MKRNIRLRRLTGGTALVGTMLMGTAAIAQTTPAAPAPSDQREAAPAAEQENAATDDIVVTAQFRGQRVQDTPIAITAVTGDALEARAQTSITDIGNFAPNVNIQPAYSSFGSAINAFIRGVGQNDSNFALEPGVGLYIDDIYYGATFGAVFDLSDLERVEVLRGPQGTLAGKNSLGGAVKLYSQKPDGSGDAYAEATFGSYRRIDLRAGFDLKLADDLFMRVSGVSKHRKGFVDRLDYGCVNPGQGIAASPRDGTGCKIGTEGDQDLSAVRVALRYAPVGPLEVNLVGDYVDDTSSSVAAKLLYAGNPNIRSYVPGSPAGGVPFDSRFITGAKSYTIYNTYSNGGNYTTVFGTPYQVLPGSFAAEPRNDVRSWGLAGTIDYDLGSGLRLKSITGYRKADGYSTTDLDGSPLDLGLNAGSFGYDQFTQELRLSARIGDLADITLGGFYYDSSSYIRQRVEFPTVLLDFLTDDPISSTSKSVFGHAEFHLGPDLNVIGGLRYTNDRKTYEFSRRNADGSAISGVPLTTNFTVAGLNGLSSTFSGDRVDYRIGLNYRFSNALMTYAQVSTGFKGGGVNPRPYNAAQAQSFGPETLTTYEVGFKSDFLNRRARLNGAVFLNKYNDIQLSLLACPDSPCALPANAGDADVFGFELEGNLQPVDGLTFSGTVGYLDFDYTRINPATGISKDAVAPFVSRWTSSASVEYAHDLGSGRITPAWTGLITRAFSSMPTMALAATCRDAACSTRGSCTKPRIAYGRSRQA
ncbi:TonB-dependent receptor [Sphingomonas hankookensis]|uniref:TonB-dependent receptor n=1 Tax=Sphingomonas hankookensis TaxID=563996 RepID=UPI003F7AAF2D